MSAKRDSEAARVRLGAPFWAFKAWCGTLYTADARGADYLIQYARVFDSVEGNTTFYHVPARETVARWREATPPGFRFCFKLPRAITHDAMLRDAGGETERFLEAMAPLEDRLGPFMIQLPAHFGPEDLSTLREFLDALPHDFAFAVELRHPAFHTPADTAGPAADADDLLREMQCERIMMDTRGLRAGDASHPDVLAAQHKKPDLPLRAVVTGHAPIARVVLHPDAGVSEPFAREWADRVASWCAQGRSPFFFLHTPSNVETPDRLAAFHRLLAERLRLEPLAPFPGRSGELASGQLGLFG